jgi:hypothetical protein
VKRVGFVLLLPLVWVPLLGFALLAFPAVPWFAWVFGLAFWLLVARRRRAGHIAPATTDAGISGPMFSPFRESGF